MLVSPPKTTSSITPKEVEINHSKSNFYSLTCPHLKNCLRASIAGTRITVELILEKLAAGETIEQILEAHPRLTREAIQAALAFAASALHADIVYPVRQTGA